MSENNIFGLALTNKPSSGYIPGSTVSGKAILNYPQQKMVNNISITVFGIAKVEFTRRETLQVFYGERIFMQTEISLVEDTRGEEIIVPAGPQEYPFNFKLPNDIPSSVKVYPGIIDYYIEIAVKKKSGIMGSIKVTKSHAIYFTVRAIVDLNERPENRNPVAITKTRQMGTKGEKILKCTFNAPKGGFAPGEMLICNIDIDNKSCKKLIKRTTLNLVQKVVITANKMKSKQKFDYTQMDTQTSHEEIVMNILSTLTGPSVPAGQRQSWVVENNIKIPNVPTTQNDMSYLVTITYEIQIEIKVSKSLRLVTFSFPILIGTIPIQDKTARPLESQIQNLQIDAPPPSYQETMAGNSRNK